MQYTIEARQLTNRHSPHAVPEMQPKQIVIEAATADDAISQFLTNDQSELVSLTRPLRGSDAVATVRKNDSMFVVRIYAG